MLNRSTLSGGAYVHSVFVDVFFFCVSDVHSLADSTQIPKQALLRGLLNEQIHLASLNIQTQKDTKSLIQHPRKIRRNTFLGEYPKKTSVNWT